MRVLKKIVLIGILCFAAVLGREVFAIEKLNFQSEIKSPSTRLKLDVFLQGFYKTDSRGFEIAAVDLNKDGVDEYILKRKTCAEMNLVCTHLVLADKKTEMHILSSIRARHIMLGGTSNYGINDLLIFENSVNDYDFDIYMWSPEEKMYILNDENTKNE